MSWQPLAVVVGGRADRLSNTVTETFRRQDVPAIRVAPKNLADLPVSLLNDTFTIRGQPVGAILFRAPPDASFSSGFIAADRSFSDTETRAIWLAAMHLKSVVAINRYDAEAWFGSAGWVRWRQVLQEANVPVAPFAFGDVDAAETVHHWYPYATTYGQPAPDRVTRRMLGSPLTTSAQARASLTVCGRVLDGKAGPAVTETARLLHARGIHLAVVSTDVKGRVLTVNTLPRIENAALVDRAVEILTGFYDEHRRRW